MCCISIGISVVVGGGFGNDGGDYDGIICGDIVRSGCFVGINNNGCQRGFDTDSGCSMKYNEWVHEVEHVH